MANSQSHASPNYPPMMKLPPKFPFYPRHLLRYEGFGYVNNRTVALNVLGCTLVSTALFFFIRHRLAKDSPAPISLSDEWREATEKKRLKLDADPITRHTIGQPVADRKKLNEALLAELERKKEE